MDNKDLTNLHKEQITAFPLAQKNFKALDEVMYRRIAFHGFNIDLQYNPARIISTNAKTDKNSLAKRPCFLCRKNMPEEQHGISYPGDYHIYINPFPIFRNHFTVPADIHTPQRIAGRFKDLLSLAKEFSEYTVFYNGPSSGASAPDHFHFQIVPQGIMPLEKDVHEKRLLENIYNSDSCTINRIQHYLREVIVMESNDRTILEKGFDLLYDIIGKTVAFEFEPQMNILSWYKESKWTVCIFPRKRWRPRQFFLEGDEKIMFSPGCVDMAGLIIAPRKEDYDIYSPELLEDLFHQVSVTREENDMITSQLNEQCKHLI